MYYHLTRPQCCNQKIHESISLLQLNITSPTNKEFNNSIPNYNLNYKNKLITENSLNTTVLPILLHVYIRRVIIVLRSGTRNYGRQDSQDLWACNDSHPRQHGRVQVTWFSFLVCQRITISPAWAHSFVRAHGPNRVKNNAEETISSQRSWVSRHIAIATPTMPATACDWNTWLRVAHEISL